MPIEWIYAALSFGWRRRRKLLAMIHDAHASHFPALGLENAGSVVQGDGWKLLTAVGPKYAGRRYGRRGSCATIAGRTGRSPRSEFAARRSDGGGSKPFSIL